MQRIPSDPDFATSFCNSTPEEQYEILQRMEQNEHPELNITPCVGPFDDIFDALTSTPTYWPRLLSASYLEQDGCFPASATSTTVRKANIEDREQPVEGISISKTLPKEILSLKQDSFFDDEEEFASIISNSVLKEATVEVQYFGYNFGSVLASPTSSTEIFAPQEQVDQQPPFGVPAFTAPMVSYTNNGPVSLELLQHAFTWNHTIPSTHFKAKATPLIASPQPQPIPPITFEEEHQGASSIAQPSQSKRGKKKGSKNRTRHEFEETVPKGQKLFHKKMKEHPFIESVHQGDKTGHPVIHPNDDNIVANTSVAYLSQNEITEEQNFIYIKIRQVSCCWKDTI